MIVGGVLGVFGDIVSVVILLLIVSVEIVVLEWLGILF